MATKRRKAGRAAAGYVRKLPSGRYQASHVYDGKRYSIGTFDAKVDADAQIRRRLVEAERGEWSPGMVEAAKAERAQRTTTLTGFAETWLAMKARRPRTVDEYRRLLAGPLADLAALPLPSITPDVVKQWWAAEHARGTLTQASRAYSLMSTILGEAVDDGLIASNPCRVKGAQTARTGRKVEPPTDAELAVILATITPRYRALVVLASAGGLRYGEATALRARDVTIDGDVVRVAITRAAVRTAGTIEHGEPKTAAGRRIVSLFEQDARDVVEHIAERNLIRDALLFPAADGVSFLSQSAFWKHWDPARKAAGRGDMPFHALRHYAGTRYAQQGATPRETMDLLGHSSLAVAMRYQHSTDRADELGRRAARRLS